MRKRKVMITGVLVAAIGFMLGAAGNALSEEYGKKDLDAFFDESGQSAINEKIAEIKFRPIVPAAKKILGIPRGTFDAKYNRLVPWAAPQANNSKAYMALTGKMNDPMFGELAEADQEVFLVKYKDLSEVRARLSSDGDGIDKRDEDLYQEGLKIDKNKERLETWQRNLNAEIERYNGTCANQPNPPSNCGSWRARLIREKAEWERQVDEHNAWGARWQSDVNGLRAAYRVFVDKITVWENKINAFSGEIVKAYEKLRRCGELKKTYDKVCPKAPFQCGPDDHCADLSANFRKNKACHEVAKERYEQCGKDPEHGRKADESEAAMNRCFSLFTGKCAGWDPIRGKCGEQQYGDLTQRLIDLVCDSAPACSYGTGDCDGPTGLKVRLKRFRDCAGAQNALNETCYEGGDRGHRQKLKQFRDAGANCEAVILKECPWTPSWRILK